MTSSTPPYSLWCEIDDLRPGEFDPENDVCDIVIAFADGGRYGMKVWTFGYLRERLEEDRGTGEHLGGKYIVPPALLVERLERALIEQVVDDLIRRDELDFELLSDEDEEDDEDDDGLGEFDDESTVEEEDDDDEE